MMRMYKMLCMLGVLCMIFFSGQVQAQVVQKQTVLVNRSIEIGSPDGDLILKVTFRKFGEPTYALTYKGKTMLQDSPLGLVRAPKNCICLPMVMADTQQAMA